MNLASLGSVPVLCDQVVLVYRTVHVAVSLLFAPKYGIFPRHRIAPSISGQ